MTTLQIIQELIVENISDLHHMVTDPAERRQLIAFVLMLIVLTACIIMLGGEPL